LILTILVIPLICYDQLYDIYTNCFFSSFYYHDDVMCDAAYHKSAFEFDNIHMLNIGLLSHSIFRATSALSHVVLGQFKTCVVLLGNYYLFKSNPGITSICGAFVAIAGMSYYTYLNVCNQKSQSEKASLRKGSSLLKSKLSKEDGDSHDGYGAESV